jgi:hypothetical protein
MSHSRHLPDDKAKISAAHSTLLIDEKHFTFSQFEMLTTKF